MKFFEKSELQTDRIISLVETKSGAGYLLKGEFTCYYLWRSDKMLKHLLTAIASWLEAGEGKVLELYRDSELPKGIGVRKALQKGKPIACQWHLTDNGYTTVKEVDEVNPFL